MWAVRKGKGKEGEGQDWLCEEELFLQIWSGQSGLQELSLAPLGHLVLGVAGLLDRTSGAHWLEDLRRWTTVVQLR